MIIRNILVINNFNLCYEADAESTETIFVTPFCTDCYKFGVWSLLCCEESCAG